jgi:quinol monooxygenase YgiN
VSLFVAIYYDVRPDRLDALLATIEQGLAASRTLQPGRRSARVFQRLGRPTDLVSLSEWSDEAAFERFTGRLATEFSIYAR